MRQLAIYGESGDVQGEIVDLKKEEFHKNADGYAKRIVYMEHTYMDEVNRCALKMLPNHGF